MTGVETSELTIAERVREDLHRFTPTERKAAHVLLAAYPVVGLETVAEFARRANVSAPTVLRFVGRLGFVGYPEFQKALRDELDKQSQSPLAKAPAAPAGGREGPLDGFADSLVDNVRETFRLVPAAEFEAVVDLLSDRRRRVHVVGGRFTDAVAMHFSTHLRVVRPGVSHMAGQPGNWRDQAIDLGSRDVLVVFDIRRYQDDLARLAGAVAGRGAAVVLMTDQWLSPIARHARHILSARVAAPSRWDSLTAMLALVEALLAAVTDQTWDDTAKRLAAIDAMRRA